MIRCSKLSIHNTDPYFFFDYRIDPNWIFLAQECKSVEAALKNNKLWKELKINGGYNCEKWKDSYQIKKIPFVVYDGNTLKVSQKEGKNAEMILVATSDSRIILLNKFEKRSIKIPHTDF